jgi:hypothetical protein
LEFFNNFGLPYRGFEAHKDSFEGKDGILPRTVRTKLMQRLGLITGEMAEEVSEVLHEVFGEDSNWHVAVIKQDVPEVAARISSRVFWSLPGIAGGWRLQRHTLSKSSELSCN